MVPAASVSVALQNLHIALCFLFDVDLQINCLWLEKPNYITAEFTDIFPREQTLSSASRINCSGVRVKRGGAGDRSQPVKIIQIKNQFSYRLHSRREVLHPITTKLLLNK